MTIIDEYDSQEADVPQAAVTALTAANRRAVQVGHPLVLIQAGSLVRVTSTGTEVLRGFPPRLKVIDLKWK